MAQDLPFKWMFYKDWPAAFTAPPSHHHCLQQRVHPRRHCYQPASLLRSPYGARPAQSFPPGRPGLGAPAAIAPGQGQAIAMAWPHVHTRHHSAIPAQRSCPRSLNTADSPCQGARIGVAALSAIVQPGRGMAHGASVHGLGGQRRRCKGATQGCGLVLLLVMLGCESRVSKSLRTFSKNAQPSCWNASTTLAEHAVHWLNARPSRHCCPKLLR